MNPMQGPHNGAELIRLESVNKVFNTLRGQPIHAVKAVSFEILPAEFVGLVGPSGCGKSTIMRMIAGLVPKTSGSVMVRGKQVAGPLKGETGIVFQQPLLLPWLTVLDNVLLPVEVLRLDRRACRERALELIQLVGLKGFESRYPFELSGGMQQRTAIVRALAFNPTILLMDEPFAAVDAITRDQLNLQLERLADLHRKTVLFITHSIPEAVFLADRVIIMSARPGRVVADVPVSLPRPRTLDHMSTPQYAETVGKVRTILLEASG
jgi:NitT/TauT family transport system ATP-binding protein